MINKKSKNRSTKKMKKSAGSRLYQRFSQSILIFQETVLYFITVFKGFSNRTIGNAIFETGSDEADHSDYHRH